MTEPARFKSLHPSCSGCGAEFVIPDDTETDFPLYAHVFLQRDIGGVVLPSGIVRMTESPLVCSPACFQKVLDDPSWKRIRRKRT